MKALFSIVLVLGCVRATAARAEERGFGLPGQWVLDGSAGLSIESRIWHNASNAIVPLNVDHSSLWLSPSALRFVARDVAVGGTAIVAYDHYDYHFDGHLSVLSFGAGALLAYRAPIGDQTFLFPQLSLGLVREHHSLGADPYFRGSGLDPDLGVSDTRVFASAFLPFAFSPAEGIFFGVGPFLRFQYAVSGILAPSGERWSVSFGVGTQIGTWL